MKKHTVILFFLLYNSFFSFSQKFTALVNQNPVKANEQLILAYRIENAGNLNLNPPKVDGMKVVGGPYVSNYSSSVNGVSTSTSEISFSIMFMKEGTYNIPPITVANKGKKYTCNSLTIQVKKNDVQIIPKGYEGKEIYVEVIPNKKKVKIGEPVALDLTIFTFTGNLEVLDLKIPEFDGGWVQEARFPLAGQVSLSSYKGKPYFKATFKRYWMIPNRLGKINYDPVKCNVMTHIYNNRREEIAQLPFDANSDTVKFVVEDLVSETKPKSYQNAVGDFEWSVKLNKTNSKNNEPIILKITVKGKGNLPLLSPPSIDWGNEFEIFKPKISDDYYIAYDGIEGEKTFEYNIAPKKNGDFKINPILFSYYNDDENKFYELASDSFNIHVEGATENFVTSNSSTPIFDNSKLTNIKTSSFFNSLIYYILTIIPFVLTFFIFFFRKRIFFTPTNMIDKNKKLAYQLVMRKMNELNTLDKDFSSNLSKILKEYIAHKFGLNINNIYKANLKTIFNQEELQNQSKQIFDEIELTQFAPTSNENLNELLNKSKKLIEMIENT